VFYSYSLRLDYTTTDFVNVFFDDSKTYPQQATIGNAATVKSKNPICSKPIGGNPIV